MSTILIIYMNPPFTKLETPSNGPSPSGQGFFWHFRKGQGPIGLGIFHYFKKKDVSNIHHVHTFRNLPYYFKSNYTPFTQLLPTRVCFTNAGVNTYGAEIHKVRKHAIHPFPSFLFLILLFRLYVKEPFSEM